MNDTERDPSCPFCLPDIQKQAFAISGPFMALYNNAPILPGHSLIIPYMHVKSLRSLPDDLMAEFFLFAREVTETLLSFFQAEAFDWTIQDSEAAGQTIPHLHLHVVVRHPGDLPDPGDWYPLLDARGKTGSLARPKLSTTHYNDITERLRLAHSLRPGKGSVRK